MCTGTVRGDFVIRTILSVIAGIVVWIVVVSLIDRTMRHFWPDYAANFAAMNFTLQMMIARLVESTVALVIASLVTVRVAPASRAACWALGIVMLLPFAYYHLTMIWEKFPIWYHAYFLASLLLVPVLMASAMRGKMN
jgi:hypothetical protein